MREPPSGNDLVIRGTNSRGMGLEYLANRIQLDHEKLGFYGLSVRACAGLDARAIFDRANLPHSHFQTTTAGMLLGIGLYFIDIGDNTHWTVKFSQNCFDDQLGEFVSVFSPPERR